MKKHGSPFKRRSQGIVKPGFCGCTVRKGTEAERLLRLVWAAGFSRRRLRDVRKGTEAERLLRRAKCTHTSRDRINVRKGTEAERLLRQVVSTHPYLAVVACQKRHRSRKAFKT